jgi:hypothetical protein
MLSQVSTSIMDGTGLEGFMSVLRRAPMRELEGADYMVTVQVTIKSRMKSKAADVPKRPAVVAFDAINDFCYAGNKAKGAEGLWTLDCDNVLAEQPSMLKAFHQQRELVRRATGDGRYILGPTTGACTFLACRHMRQRFNNINYYPYLFSDKHQSHWLTVHKNNPAVPILIARFEMLKNQPNITDLQLDERAGANPLTSEWMAEHAEEVGDDGMRSLEGELMADLFEPGDISTNLARAQWAETKKEEYKHLLATRQQAEEPAMGADQDGEVVD